MSNKVESFSEFDKMPTEKLRSLLSLDIDAAPGEVLSPDAILHILGVIQAREKAEGTEPVDVATAWDEFNKNYRPSESSADSDANLLPPDTLLCTKPKKHLHLKRTIITLAAVLAVFVGSTIAANAADFDLWGVIVQWASQTFGFDNNIVYQDKIVDKQMLPCEDLQELLDYYEIDLQLVPTQLPDGFEQVSCERTESPQLVKFVAAFKNGEKELTMQIFEYPSEFDAQQTYEKLPEGHFTYEAGGIQHYIATNNDGTVIALWKAENYECSIYGNVNETEMEQIINSIYGE